MDLAVLFLIDELFIHNGSNIIWKEYFSFDRARQCLMIVILIIRIFIDVAKIFWITLN